MKTILVMAAVLALAGCQKKGTASGADTSAMTADTGMGMMHSDSTMMRDTTKK